MSYVKKHLSISEKTYEVIKRRDKKRFPLERDFIDEAILTYGERASLEELFKEIREVKEQVTQLNQTVGWE